MRALRDPYTNELALEVLRIRAELEDHRRR
jgi:hypothetical protein